MKIMLHTIFATLCLLMTNASFADDFEAEKTACSEDSTKKWDNNLNRCMTRETVKNDLDAYRNCTLFEEKAKRDKCMRDLVIEVSGNVKLDDANWDAVIMDTITTGISATNLFIRTKGKSPCLSLKVASGCGLAALAKDGYIILEAKKVIKENLASFQKKVEDSENYDTQLIAYQSQIDQLNSLSDFYYEKEKLHKLVAACYTVAAVATAADEVEMKLSCLDATEDNVEAKSEEYDTEGLDGGASVAKVAKALFKDLKYYAGTPAGVAVLSLMNTGWNLLKAKKLREQGDKANLLAKRAKVAKDQFITSMEKYCPNGNDDKNDLVCYCYIDGEKNSSRTNSESCQGLWAQNERNLYAESSDKTAASSADTTKMGCITNVGEYDPSCQCRKFKDTQGNNACKKASFSSVQLGGLGQTMDITQLETDLNNITSGITSAQGFDLTSSQSSALGGTVRDSILKQIKLEDKDGIKQATPNDLALAQKALLKKVSTQLSANPLQSNPIESSLSSIQEKLNNSDIEKKNVSEIKKLKLTGGKGSLTTNKKEQFALNVGRGSSKVEKYPSYMKKSYKTENADVVTNKDVSIFKVLSNRYYKSGFKRLFED